MATSKKWLYSYNVKSYRVPSPLYLAFVIAGSETLKPKSSENKSAKNQ